MDVTRDRPETTRSILEAAEAEFGSVGYRRATIGTIAREAGVSRPLVYRYFDDKDGLYRAVVASVLSEWHEALAEAAARSTPSTAHTLRAVIVECVRWAAGRPLLRGLLLRDLDIAGRVARSTIDEGRALLPGLLRRLIEQGIDRGEIRSDLDVGDVVAVITDATIAATLPALRDPVPGNESGRTDALVELVLYGLVVHPGAPAG